MTIYQHNYKKVILRPNITIDRISNHAETREITGQSLLTQDDGIFRYGELSFTLKDVGAVFSRYGQFSPRLEIVMDGDFEWGE